MSARLIEDVAKNLYANRAGYRRQLGLAAFDWHDLSEGSREQFRSMAQAAIAVMHGNAMLFGRPTLRERLGARWRAFVRNNLVANNPWETKERQAKR